MTKVSHRNHIPVSISFLSQPRTCLSLFDIFKFRPYRLILLNLVVMSGVENQNQQKMLIVSVQITFGTGLVFESVSGEFLTNF